LNFNHITLRERIHALYQRIPIDEKEYENKIFMYLAKFIEMLENSHPEIKNRKHDILIKSYELWYVIKANDIKVNEKVKQQNKQKRTIAEIFEKHGFNINLLRKIYCYRYFLPQKMALFLLRMSYKAVKKSDTEKQLKNDISMKTILRIFNVKMGKIRYISSFFRESLQLNANISITYTQINSKELFIKELEDVFNKTKTHDAEIILKLFKYLDLNPMTFGKEVISLKDIHGARGVLKYLEDKTVIQAITYGKTKENIIKLYKDNRIQKKGYENAIQLLNEVIMNKSSIDFIHRGLHYKFTLNNQRLKAIKDSQLKIKLQKFLYQVFNGKIPTKLFLNEYILSGSKCKLAGNKHEKVETSYIKSNLIRPLMHSGKIQENNPRLLKKFSDRANILFKQSKKNPIHTPIQEDLYKSENATAVEVPIWFKRSDGKYMTGHVDAIDIESKEIQVIDYKRSIEEMAKGLPQICTYAYILNQRLRIKNIEAFKCIIYYKDRVWSFSPTILNDILIFVKNLNAKRNARILCRDKKSDLEHELAQILNTI